MSSPIEQAIADLKADIATMQAQVAQLQTQPSPMPTPTPTPSGTPPVLSGWGGLFADSASLDQNLDILQARGYNAFRCMIYNADFPRTPSLSSVVAAVQNAKARGMWIILDYHGYNEPFQNEQAWLSFWQTILQNVGSLYDKIIYEPCNEPIAPDVPTLTAAYQSWLLQCRNMGDNHWAIISVNNYFSGDAPNLIDQFPLTINDPNTLWSWHEYYMFQYHPAWTIADAQSFAQGVAAQADKLKAAGKTPFMSEFGADSGTAAPDVVATGSAGYAPESLAYVNELVSQLTSKGAGYMLWTADDWTDTPGAGATGALNIWGQLLGQTVTPPPPPPPTPSPPPVTGKIDTVFLVAMENQNYVDVLGTGTGISAAPYLQSLLPIGATIPNFHGAFPGSSEGSYIALISGDTYGASNGTTGIGDASTKTLAQLFQAKGVAWEAYREDSNGRGGDHFPFLDFNSTVNDPALMSHVHSGVSGAEYANLAKTAGPGFYWLTPSDSNNMHDNTVTEGDIYLKTIIPTILSNPAFAQGRALLIIWWDEYDPAPNLFIGGKQGYVSPGSYDHYSILKLIEQIFSLPTMTTNDASAIVPDIL